MKAYKYLINYLYVFIISTVNVLVYNIKDLKQLSNNSSLRSIRLLPSKKSIKTSKKQRRTTLSAESLYLNEKYLRAMKLVQPGVDSKSIVDRATKQPLDAVLVALESLDERNVEEIREFVRVYLHEPGMEIVNAELLDWNCEPAFLANIRNDHLRQFSMHLNQTWKDLYKKFDTSLLGPGCVSSHLAMRHPFVVPGGRFREIYYWDTFWTMEGLLVCGLFDTCRQMIENFSQFIDDYGFIPNGSRLYYLNRSQPPYFCQMIARYYEASMRSSELEIEEKKEVERFVLEEALPRMVREYEFWMTKKSIKIRLSTRRSSKLYRLNIYR